MARLTRKQKRAVKRAAGNTVNLIFKLFVSVLFLFPFYWMVTTSFKPYLETLKFPPTLWPQDFTFEGYVHVFQELDILSYMEEIPVCIAYDIDGKKTEAFPFPSQKNSWQAPAST